MSAPERGDEAGSQAAAFPPGFRERVLRNTVFGIGGRIAGLVVQFLLTPYVFARLGTERYAIYALAGTVTGYLALLDLGLGTGYVKYVAEAAARDDRDGVNEVLSSGFYGYLAFGALLLALWWAARERVVAFLIAEPALRPEATAAFTMAVLVLALQGAASAFRAVLYGFQHIDVATRVGVLLIVPRVALVVLALEAGLGVLGVVGADLVLFLIGTGVMAWSARAVFPQLSIRVRRLSRGGIGRLLGYGTTLQVSRLSEMVNFGLDKVLLSRFVGLAAVTDYEIASRVLSTVRSFPLLLVNAIVPAVSELEARGMSQGIERIAARSLRALLLTGSLLFGLVAFEAPRILQVWMGPGHEASALAVRVLALGYLLNVASGAFTSVTQGIARNEYQMKLALLALLLNAGLSLALVQWLGYPGVLIGTGVALVASYVYADVAFRRLAARVLDRLPRFGARVYGPPLLAAVVAGIAAWALDRVLPLPLGRSAFARLEGLLLLALPAALYVAAFAAALLALRAFEPAEKELARRIAARIGRRSRAA